MRFLVDPASLPKDFPTHGHTAEFWETLGRTVATFGFLEEILGKAVFAFTATRRIPEDQVEAEFEKWLPTLERALSDPLGGLIDSYGKVVRVHAEAQVSTQELDHLLEQLRQASIYRNVLCHGSWRSPDDSGRSIPLFVDKRSQIFETPIDAAFLEQIQRHVAELACLIVNTVTQMGWQFPGSKGPGNPIWPDFPRGRTNAD